MELRNTEHLRSSYKIQGCVLFLLLSVSPAKPTGQEQSRVPLQDFAVSSLNIRLPPPASRRRCGCYRVMQQTPFVWRPGLFLVSWRVSHAHPCMHMVIFAIVPYVPTSGEQEKNEQCLAFAKSIASNLRPGEVPKVSSRQAQGTNRNGCGCRPMYRQGAFAARTRWKQCGVARAAFRGVVGRRVSFRAQLCTHGFVRTCCGVE